MSDDSRERKITRLLRGRTYVSLYKSRGEGPKVDRGKRKSLAVCGMYEFKLKGNVSIYEFIYLRFL